MNTEKQPIAEIHIKVENHGGTIYISSDDVPGLWLWGKDPKQVFEAIGSTIELLYKYNHNKEVRAQPCHPSGNERWTDTESQPRDFRIYPVMKNSLAPGGGDGRQAME